MEDTVIRSVLTAAAALSLLVGGTAGAAPCKDPKTHKFVKCPPAKPVPPKHCKDGKGKFVKCGTPGAKPA
jgi:hypothetical protein